MKTLTIYTIFWITNIAISIHHYQHTHLYSTTYLVMDCIMSIMFILIFANYVKSEK